MEVASQQNYARQDGRVLSRFSCRSVQSELCTARSAPRPAARQPSNAPFLQQLDTKDTRSFA